MPYRNLIIYLRTLNAILRSAQDGTRRQSTDAGASKEFDSFSKMLRVLGHYNTSPFPSTDILIKSATASMSEHETYEATNKQTTNSQNNKQTN